MLIARAELAPGHVRDVRIDGELITAVENRLRPRRDEDVLDARGAAVVPGLHDHHIHLRALAAAASSLDLRAVGDRDAFEAALRDACANQPVGAWVRVVGYHESIAGTLERSHLDRLTPPGTPVRVQHRSGALWILNTAGVTAMGVGSDDEPGVDAERGHLLRRDDLLRRVSRLDVDPLTRLGAAAAAVGITGFTDATPDGAAGDARELARDLRAAGVEQSLVLMGPVGAVAPDVPRAELGPVKVLLDDHALPSLDDFAATISAAHAERRAVAIHCVTRVQLVLALVALESAGGTPGDRIEHGSVIPHEVIGRLADLGTTVVTQPHFVAERGDEYLDAVDVDDIDSLYRVRSLQHAGVAVAAGTDAPFGAFDPWASVAAAIDRRTRRGRVLGPDERVGAGEALDLYLGQPHAPGRRRTIGPGAPADLCILGQPMHEVASAVGPPEVRATVVAGRLVSPSGVAGNLHLEL